jgi:hypothetical protein
MFKELIIRKYTRAYYKGRVRAFNFKDKDSYKLSSVKEKKILHAILQKDPLTYKNKTLSVIDSK